MILSLYTKRDITVPAAYIGAQIEFKPTSTAINTRWLVPGMIVKLVAFWAYIQPEQDVWDWSALDKIVAALAGKHPVLFCIRTAPAWATGSARLSAVPDTDAYATFVKALIERYGSTVFGVELGNEPDVPVDAFSPEMDIFVGSPTFGVTEKAGAAYAVFVNAVTVLVKETYPDHTLVAGGLMYSGSYVSEFVKGMKGVGIIADAISFHSYPQNPALPDVTASEIVNHTVRRLVQLKTAFPDKPIWLTETSIVSGTDSELLRQRQADYFDLLITNPQLYDYLAVIIWYTLANNGWNNTDLVAANVPQLAYERFKYWLTVKLGVQDEFTSGKVG
jgi:hypothetical protein